MRVTRTRTAPEAWAFLIAVAACVVPCVALACSGPRGYNVVTGVRVAGPGTFGPTGENIATGLGTGVGIGLIPGALAAGLTRVARRGAGAKRGRPWATGAPASP